ncbi:MAG: hypothetical protein OXC00_07895 [Acidimicrobiaceae bacterium]|nr:hypothetical protein [Acidimicrobiaceae bacterium]
MLDGPGETRPRTTSEAKDDLRGEVWTALERTSAGVGAVRSRIPNFVRAHEAADRLAKLDIWKQASVVKSNPDPAQAHVRLRALQDGKTLYAPVPELTESFPFVRLDPAELESRRISFENVMFSEGAVEIGVPVQFEEMEAFDIVVVGCVAATRAGGRTGKGGGFADLELGIFRDVGLVQPGTPIVATVHGSQVVDDGRVAMVKHDTPLDWIITPDEVIETRTSYPRPGGVDWPSVQPDQLAGIPFLAGLRA